MNESKSPTGGNLGRVSAPPAARNKRKIGHFFPTAIKATAVFRNSLLQEVEA